MQPEAPVIAPPEFFDWIEDIEPEIITIDDHEFWTKIAPSPAVLVHSQKAYDSLRHKFGQGGFLSRDKESFYLALYNYCNGDDHNVIQISSTESPKNDPIELAIHSDSLELFCSRTSMYWMMEGLSRGLSDSHVGNGVYNSRELEQVAINETEYYRVFDLEGGRLTAYFTERPQTPEHIVHPVFMTLSRAETIPST